MQWGGIVMDQKQPLEIQGKPVRRVGVIIVHGIGEQKRFEFLEGETRKIVDAIIANYGQRRRDVTPTLTTGAGDPYLGAQSSWVSGPQAPLHVLVDLRDRIIDIAFHEVWWADINETLTLGKQFRFWLWGLSLAGIASHDDPFLLGAIERMRPPHNHGELSTRNRLLMGYVSILFGLSAFSIALINMILKRLDFQPFPLTATVVNYLSAVKLYSQDSRAGGSPMDGPDEPPRAAIRRRMIRVMIDVARSGYDRWYILAHSLGTIVAWNGLMEIQQALPNYLDRKCWQDLEGTPLRGTIKDAFDVDKMMPNRPVWVKADEIINRDALFENFRGVLTYGSPLERFCALWSAMVPINKVEDPFRPGTEWINVYDPTDPVGTWVKDFNPGHELPRDDHAKLTAHNFPCRASRWLLLSHLCYLNPPKREMPDSGDYLINKVSHWLVEGGSLAEKLYDAPKDRKSFWMPRAPTEPATHRRVWWRVFSRMFQAGIVGLFLTWLTLLSLEYVVVPLLRIAKGILSPFVKTVLIAIKASGVIAWISSWLTLMEHAVSWASQKSSSSSDFLAAYFHVWTWIPRLIIEGILLWIVMFLVVVVACLINNHKSSREREQLRVRYAPSTEHATP
jgi:hypothetical protein